MQRSLEDLKHKIITAPLCIKHNKEDKNKPYKMNKWQLSFRWAVVQMKTVWVLSGKDNSH